MDKSALNTPITPETDLFAEIPKRGPGRPRKPKPPPGPPKERRVREGTPKVVNPKKRGRKGVFDRDGAKKANPGIVPASNIDSINNSNICSSKDGLEVSEKVEDMIKGSSLKDLKAKLSGQELKFINYHLGQGLGIEQSMILAGYEGLSKSGLYFVAKRTVERYEAQAEDRRQIMRALGVGEVAVVKRLWHEAQTAASAGARVQALTTLGKWLGLDTEAIQGAQGITVIIQALEGGAQQINLQPPGQPALPEPGGYRHPQPARPGQPITITK